MIEESYDFLASWDFKETKAINVARWRTANSIGAKTETWLRDVGRVMSRRFDPSGRDRPLALLARARCALEVWKPLLLWHMTRDEFLLRDFLLCWLFPAFDEGVYRVRPEELHKHLRNVRRRGGQTQGPWSDSTIRRVGAGLLKIAADFGLLRGSAVKVFSSYHLPETSFLYLLHALREVHRSPRRLIESADWRMFLMHREDVERELLRLHQFRRVRYQVAGSLVELTLPSGTLGEYAERMVA
jgi:hypothetical protein